MYENITFKKLMKNTSEALHVTRHFMLKFHWLSNVVEQMEDCRSLHILRAYVVDQLQ